MLLLGVFWLQFIVFVDVVWSFKNRVRNWFFFSFAHSPWFLLVEFAFEQCITSSSRVFESSIFSFTQKIAIRDHLLLHFKKNIPRLNHSYPNKRQKIITNLKLCLLYKLTMITCSQKLTGKCWFRWIPSLRKNKVLLFCFDILMTTEKLSTGLQHLAVVVSACDNSTLYHLDE